MGYFDLISRADEFIFLEDVQYTKRDWRNRNFIKTASGAQRLTVPVVQGSREKRIEEVETAGSEWALTHWRSISQAYAHAPHFQHYKPGFEIIYATPPKLLSLLNRQLIRVACDCMGIKTPLTVSTDYGRFSGKNERLIALCQAAGATHYLSGPSAESYLDRAAFEKAGLRLEIMRYTYPAYRQMHGAFMPNLSILDLIFNEGPRAMSVIRGEAVSIPAA